MVDIGTVRGLTCLSAVEVTLGLITATVAEN
jgi:hypothetical protein